MTSNVVLDSCIAAKFVLPEHNSRDAMRCLADILSAGGQAYVADFAWAEIANALWRRYVRGLLSEADVIQGLSDLTGVPLTFLPFQPLLRDALVLAVRYRISVYDALFVALVHDKGCDGITSDEPLIKAVSADFPQIKLLRNWP